MALSKTLWQSLVDLVSTGQDASDQFDIAFGNIDDAIDQVDTNTLNITSLQAPKEVVKWTPLAKVDKPAHIEGQVYFSADYSTMMIQGKVDGVEIEGGHNMIKYVVNNSGAIIEKGMACRPDGTAGGEVQIVKAIATSFNEASVFGLAAADIADGAIGAVVVMGDLRDFDTNGLTSGEPQFLSDSVAGTYSSVKPAIKSQVGGVITTDAVDGHFYVNINNNISLPLMLGSLLGATAPTSIPADLVNYTPITAYASNIDIVTQADKASGIITPLLDGTYRLNISMHCFFDNVGGAGKKEFYIALRDVTDNVIEKEFRGFILKDAETYDFSSNGALDLLAGHEYRLELKSELLLTNFAFSSSTYYIESIIY